MYLVLARELKKLWNMKMTVIPIVIGVFGTVTKGLLIIRLGSWRTSGDHPNGQNTKKSSGDLRRLAVSQFSVKDRQLKLM